MFIAAPAPIALASEAVRRLVAAALPAIPAPAAVLPATALSGNIDPRSDAAALAARFAGRTVGAVVIEHIDAREGEVEIDGLRLRVVADLPPRGQAVLLRFSAGTPGVASSAPEPGPSTTASATPPGGATQVSLAPLARTLAALATQGTPTLSLGPIAAPVAAPQAFAQALAALIRDSGIFYESHLARWSRGQYPLAQLRGEPQAKTGVPEATSVAAATTASTALASAPAPASAILAAASGAILREQLDVLEHRQFAVALEPWPGQAAVVEIRHQRADRHSGQGDASHDAPASQWSTTLALDLPQLGQVTCHLAIAGTRLTLAIHATEGSTARLERGSGELVKALSDTGMQVAGMRISHDPDH